jgi:hypothetical protein
MDDYAAAFPLLFRRRWPATRLSAAIEGITTDGLIAEYKGLRSAAPSRSLTGKRYFVGHSGSAPLTPSNRLEERLAIALCGRTWTLPAGGSLRLLDYQVPLKARRSDAAVGKIDLFGVTDAGRAVIVELKVMAQAGGRSDSPLAAMLEGLRYAAILEADFEAIAAEAARGFDVELARGSPLVAVLAPTPWWQAWQGLRAAGAWERPLQHMAAQLQEATGVSVSWLAIDEVGDQAWNMTEALQGAEDAREWR